MALRYYTVTLDVTSLIIYLLKYLLCFVSGSNASNSGLHVKQVGNVEMILSGKDAEVAALEEEDRKELKEEVPVIVPGKKAM